MLQVQSRDTAAPSFVSSIPMTPGRGTPKALAFPPAGTKFAFSSEKIALLYDVRTGKAATLSAGNHPEDSLISVSFLSDGVGRP